MNKISEAELKVMQILWKNKKATSFDIIDELKEKEEWTESTIRTLLNRLQTKKVIRIVEKNGKVYTYEPIIQEEAYKYRETNNFLQKFYNGSLQSMILNFTKQNPLNKQETEKLLNMIEHGERKDG